MGLAAYTQLSKRAGAGDTAVTDAATRALVELTVWWWR